MMQRITIYLKEDAKSFMICSSSKRDLSAEDAYNIHPLLQQFANARSKTEVINCLKQLQQISKQDMNTNTGHAHPFFIPLHENFNIIGTNISYSLWHSHENLSRFDKHKEVHHLAHRDSFAEMIQYVESSWLERLSCTIL